MSKQKRKLVDSKSKKGLDVFERIIDLNCIEEYNRLFSELNEDEKEEFKDKPLYWVEGIWINPDGTTFEE